MSTTALAALAAIAGSIVTALVAYLRLRYQASKDIRLEEPKLQVELTGRLLTIADESVERMRAEVAEALQRVDELEVQVEECRAMRARLEQMEAHVATIEGDRDRLRAENTDLRTKARELKGRVESLETEVAELRRKQ